MKHILLFGQKRSLESENEIGKIKWLCGPNENPTELIELSKNNLVALLIVGILLQATTHVDLQLQASEAGIDCMVFHGISITTLVTGQSDYRTINSTTDNHNLPLQWMDCHIPSRSNRYELFFNQHTLALLDLVQPVLERVNGFLCNRKMLSFSKINEKKLFND